MSAARKMIVVLGMHRSGTSLLTKGLEALGVDLGGDFHPITPDNPKGYWENRGFHGLNEELLATLGRSWDSVDPLEEDSILQLYNDVFKTRALALIKECLAWNTVTGVKDPRFCLLLPFWKKAFEEADAPVSYVISFRNPLSVAESLSRRDSFPREKALQLWLAHNRNILAGTARISCKAIVDYDDLIDASPAQLARIARILDLPVNPEILAAYSTEFLEPGLRHTRFSLEHVGNDPTCGPEVFALYEMLRAGSLGDAP